MNAKAESAQPVFEDTSGPSPSVGVARLASCLAQSLDSDRRQREER